MSEIDSHVAELIEAHSAAGRTFEAAGVRGFALDSGDGAPVLLIHGVPVSSFLYRRVVPMLAGEGLRAVAPDLPGLGLAARPREFDYSWSGLAAWLGHAVDALEIDRCHLVIHDIGGPIGCEWAIRNPDRVLSLTALNTLLDVGTFRPPWTMYPFTLSLAGELWLHGTPRRVFSELFYLQGIAERGAISRAEIYAHHALLKRGDRGSAFLRIMRSYQLTAEHERFLADGLARRRYPAQVVWGRLDPALKIERREAVTRMLGVSEPTLLDAKHFLQEDHAAEVARAVSDIAAPLG